MLTQAVINQCAQDFRDIRGFDRSELVHLEEGFARARAYPGPDSVNDVGTVHGGFLLAIADQAAAAAAESLGSTTVTANMNAGFYRAAYADDAFIDITAHLIHAGRKTIVAEVEMFNPQEQLLFKGSFTLMPLAKIGGEGGLS